MSGPDVAQLQSALKTLGYSAAGDKKGHFGTGTSKAVTAFYRAHKFAPLRAEELVPGLAESLSAAVDNVTSAQRALRVATDAVANAKRASGQPGDSLPQARREASYAREDLAVANRKLAALQARTGACWPLAEIVYSPSMPASVTSIDAPVGTDLNTATSARIMTLSVGEPRVTTIVPQGSQEGLRVGMDAVVADDISGEQLPGRVDQLGGFQAAADSDPQTGAAATPAGYPVRIAGEKGVPLSWLGRDVRVTITVRQTARPVLVVPVAAVVTSPDDSTWVSVLRSDGGQVPVAVTTGLIAAGQVEVAPTDPAALHAGMKVIVG